MARLKVALRYCGSCNPYTDLARIARYIANLSKRRGDFLLVPYTEEPIDIVIILCGCPRKCGAKKELIDNARFSFVVVPGGNLSTSPFSETQLLQNIDAELDGAIKALGPTNRIATDTNYGKCANRLHGHILSDDACQRGEATRGLTVHIPE